MNNKLGNYFHMEREFVTAEFKFWEEATLIFFNQRVYRH